MFGAALNFKLFALDVRYDSACLGRIHAHEERNISFLYALFAQGALNACMFDAVERLDEVYRSDPCFVLPFLCFLYEQGRGENVISHAEAFPETRLVRTLFRTNRLLSMCANILYMIGRTAIER